MKLSTKIIIGVLFLLAALSVLSYAFLPNLPIFTVALWKWFVLAILLYWFVLLVGFGRTLANRLSAVIPLALMFIVFENDIARALGLQPNFVNRWIILLGAGLIFIGVQILFSKVKTSKVEFTSNVNVNQNQTSYTEYTSNTNGEDKTTKSFSMGSNVCYIDAVTQQTAYVSNKMGQLNVFYQNIDVGDTTLPLNLEVENKLGETIVHVPKDWFVNVKLDNSLGEIDVRNNPDVTTRQLNLTAKNSLGDIKVIDIQ